MIFMDMNARNPMLQSLPNTNNLGLGIWVQAKLSERKLVSSNLFLGSNPAEEKKTEEFEFADNLWTKGQDKKGSNYLQLKSNLSTKGGEFPGECNVHT